MALLLSLSPDESARDTYTGGNLIGYAGDKSFAGTASQIDLAMQLLLQHGPPCGYFPEPEKKTLIYCQQDQAAMQQRLNRYQFQYKCASRYLGSFIGDNDEYEAWPKTQQVKDWVCTLATIASVSKKELRRGPYLRSTLLVKGRKKTNKCLSCILNLPLHPSFCFH